MTEEGRFAASAWWQNCSRLRFTVLHLEDDNITVWCAEDHCSTLL